MSTDTTYTEVTRVEMDYIHDKNTFACHLKLRIYTKDNQDPNLLYIFAASSTAADTLQSLWRWGAITPVKEESSP